MKITIIHKEDCPLCEMAIKEFTDDGHEVELHNSLADIRDIERRNNMMADMMTADGDKDALPNVFAYDRFIPWQPKRKG